MTFFLSAVGRQPTKLWIVTQKPAQALIAQAFSLR
jgi:hypothetical protein